MLTITVLADLAVGMTFRGIPFLAHDVLHLSTEVILLLTMSFGVCYVPTALVSHRLCVALGERRVLAGSLWLEAGACLLTAAFGNHPQTWVLFACMGLLGASQGFKWPVIESYISAGRGAAAQARAVGSFNLAWAGAFPVAVFLAGPLIDWWPPALFLVPALIDGAMLAMTWTLPLRPAHLPEGHPERPDGTAILRWRRLLLAGRVTNLLSQCSTSALAALMPMVYASLGISVFWGTGLSGVLDLVRFLAFLVLQAWTGWHGRRSPLVLSMAALVVGFFMIVLGGNVAVVLAGEVLFGVAVAMTYYAALYYAMLAQNATVQAGGVHEALIGLGSVVGPASGLLSMKLVAIWGAAALGMAAGMSPLFLLCLGASAVSLLRTGRRNR